MTQLFVHIRSFDQYCLERTSETLRDFFQLCDISVKDIAFPTHRKKITVLRSPHIDKKSREQFQLQTYKRAHVLETSSRDLARFLLSVVRNSTFPGVEISLQVKVLDYYHESSLDS